MNAPQPLRHALLRSLPCHFLLVLAAVSPAQEPAASPSAPAVDPATDPLVHARELGDPAIVATLARQAGVALDLSIRVDGDVLGRVSKPALGRALRRTIGGMLPLRDVGETPYTLRVEWSTLCNGPGTVMSTQCTAALIQRGTVSAGREQRFAYREVAVWRSPLTHLFGTAFNGDGAVLHLNGALSDLLRSIRNDLTGEDVAPLRLAEAFPDADRELLTLRPVDTARPVLEDAAVWGLLRERGVLVAVEPFNDAENWQDWLAGMGVTPESYAADVVQLLREAGIPAGADVAALRDCPGATDRPLVLGWHLQVSPLQLPAHSGGHWLLGVAGFWVISDSLVLGTGQPSSVLMNVALARTETLQSFDLAESGAVQVRVTPPAEILAGARRSFLGLLLRQLENAGVVNSAADAEPAAEVAAGRG